jgi:hypothetical protein
VKPVRIFRLEREAFENAATACQGEQIAAVAVAVGDVRSGLTWYAADVQTIGPSLVASRRPIPELIGGTSTLASAARSVAQFESGVFVAVPSGYLNPKFRSGGLWTEDEEAADLCDALVEVRAFDTTSVSVATNDDAIADRIAEKFVGAHVIRS